MTSHRIGSDQICLETLSHEPKRKIRDSLQTGHTSIRAKPGRRQCHGQVIRVLNRLADERGIR